MRPFNIFSGATGLNIVEDPVRIAQTKDGKSDLQVAVNITIDQSYRPKTRDGVEKKLDGSFHSLFSNGNVCYVVKGESLFEVAADFTLTGIRSGLTLDARMAYASVGDRTYYTNGTELGYIKDTISNVWGIGTYAGVDTNRVFSAPMAGQHLAEFLGRMFISEGNVLWWSEPFNFGLFNKGESFVQFHTKIRMIKAVSSGLFISTEKSMYFMQYQDRQFTCNKVAAYPAVEWSDASELVDGYEVGFKTGGLCAVWASPEGVIVGSPEGFIYNTNKNKVIYPEGKTGFGCIKGYNYIHGVK